MSSVDALWMLYHVLYEGLGEDARGRGDRRAEHVQVRVAVEDVQREHGVRAGGKVEVEVHRLVHRGDVRGVHPIGEAGVRHVAASENDQRRQSERPKRQREATAHRERRPRTDPGRVAPPTRRAGE